MLNSNQEKKIHITFNVKWIDNWEICGFLGKHFEHMCFEVVFGCFCSISCIFDAYWMHVRCVCVCVSSECSTFLILMIVWWHSTDDFCLKFSFFGKSWKCGRNHSNILRLNNWTLWIVASILTAHTCWNEWYIQQNLN